MAEGSKPAGGKLLRFHSAQLMRDGDAGIYATVRVMQAMVYGPGGVKSPEVRVAALQAVRGVDRGMDEIAAVHSYVKQNIEFRGEYAETLQEPRVTLQLGAGDCDDHSMLIMALLLSLGIRARFKTVAVPSAPDTFAHVYVEALDRRTGQWVPLDSTVPGAGPGWEPPDATRSQTYAVMGASHPLSFKAIAVTVGLLFAASYAASHLERRIL